MGLYQPNHTGITLPSASCSRGNAAEHAGLLPGQGKGWQRCKARAEYLRKGNNALLDKAGGGCCSQRDQHVQDRASWQNQGSTDGLAVMQNASPTLGHFRKCLERILWSLVSFTVSHTSEKQAKILSWKPCQIHPVQVNPHDLHKED